jgi:septal ring factor EnvC (AmiA/AmiB activator)
MSQPDIDAAQETADAIRGILTSKMTRADLAERCANLERHLGAQVRATTSVRAELHNAREDADRAKKTLALRDTELDRLRNVSNDITLTSAELRSEIRELTQARDRNRRDIDGLKVRLHNSEQEVARLAGQLERVREADQLRLAAMMGRAPAQHSPMTVGESPMGSVGYHQRRDDVDWVTF